MNVASQKKLLGLAVGAAITGGLAGYVCAQSDDDKVAADEVAKETKEENYARNVYGPLVIHGQPARDEKDVVDCSKKLDVATIDEKQGESSTESVELVLVHMDKTSESGNTEELINQKT